MARGWIELDKAAGHHKPETEKRKKEIRKPIYRWGAR
jgi:hypothetical protein